VYVSCSAHFTRYLTLSFQFKEKEIQVHYKKEVVRTYIVRYRPLLDILLEQLEDPDLADLFTFYPERRYVRKQSGEGLERMWEELWMGDDWWDIQVRFYPAVFTKSILASLVKSEIDDDAVVIAVMIYADQARMSAFGNTKVWGVFAYMGNMIKARRHNKGKEKGGAALVGFLPEVRLTSPICLTSY
jgi:hypothetical protein